MEAKLKRIATDIYSFEDLISRNSLYVDKTDFIHEMLTGDTDYFFLSRPRRFGKSLTISTLKAVFQGKRELFKGLKIEHLDYDWKEYPVIHLDMGRVATETREILNESLNNLLHILAEDLNIILSEAIYAPHLFQELINKAYKMGKVVLLIDEYDKPLTDNFGMPHLEEVRILMENFYAVVKASDPYLRFVLMTGVAKFAKVSIFSKLNNLYDITMDSQYACMLGYTQEELEDNFTPYLDKIVAEQGLVKEDFMAEIKLFYNGYKFDENASTVYNPVSFGMFLKNKGKFKNYWFATGTPSLLMKLAKEQSLDLTEMLSRRVESIYFDAFDISKLQLMPLLIQTGYLTIDNAEIIDGRMRYQFDFPNVEVEEAFLTHILTAYSTDSLPDTTDLLDRFKKHLDSENIDDLIQELQSFYASIPYDLNNKASTEAYYHTVFYCIFHLLPYRFNAEMHTNKGRIDAVCESYKAVFIFEFKHNESAEIAMDQTKTRGYADKYASLGKPIHLVAINFSSDDKNITESKHEICALN
ncbi:ATPase AAA [Bacteroidales bacterium]|nr:ATPase AAA [Bacteroidales bacterium]